MDLKLYKITYDFYCNMDYKDIRSGENTFRRILITAKNDNEARLFFNYFITHNNYIIPDNSITCEKMRKTKKYINYYSEDYYIREIELFKSWGLLED